MLFGYQTQHRHNNPPVYYKAGLPQLLCAVLFFRRFIMGVFVSVWNKIMTRLIKRTALQTEWDCLCSILSVSGGELQIHTSKPQIIFRPVTIIVIIGFEWGRAGVVKDVFDKGTITSLYPDICLCMTLLRRSRDRSQSSFPSPSTAVHLPCVSRDAFVIGFCLPTHS